MIKSRKKRANYNIEHKREKSKERGKIMGNFFLQAAAAVTGMLFSFLLLLAVWPFFTSLFFPRRYARLVTNRYWEDWLEIFHILKERPAGRRLGVKSASCDENQPRFALRRRKVKSPWESLLFNPVYLHRLPGLDYRAVGTEVVIGPCSRRPLRLKIPILIGGMAYQTALNAWAKQALALGATMAGTAVNSGSGPFLPAERFAAEKLIVQYARGHLGKDLEVLRQADAIEIQLGQGLWGPVPGEIPLRRLARTPNLQELLSVEQGEKAVIPPRLLAIRTPADLRELIENLRRKTGGIPVGVKIGGTGELEKELDLLLRAGPDFLAIDSLEGGNWGTAGDFGLPTLYAVARARKFLEEKNLRGKVTLLAGGGLVTPMDFLKAMALGADAVFIGTVALVALVHHMAGPFLPRVLPVEIVFHRGSKGKKLNITEAARGLEFFLKKAVQEMQETALCLGKEHLSEVSLRDLSATNRELAAYLGVAWCGQEAE